MPDVKELKEEDLEKVKGGFQNAYQIVSCSNPSCPINGNSMSGYVDFSSNGETCFICFQGKLTVSWK